MNRRSWLVPLALALCIHCSDDEDCEDLCDKLIACGFLPSPMGATLDNCVSRCEASDQVFEKVNECTEDKTAGWPDQSADEVAEPSGCPAIAACLGDASLRGYGSVTLVPMPEYLSTNPDLGNACEPVMTQAEAEQTCATWRVARATTILEDSEGQRKTAFGSCATLLARQPIWEHVLVGPVRAELILHGNPEPTSEGGASGVSGGDSGVAGASVANSGAGGMAGAAAASLTELESCYVFKAPEQLNRAGKCVRVELPFTTIGQAKECERDALCTDSQDNDEDGWTDCDDPKCAEYCDQFMSAAPETETGGSPATQEMETTP